VGGSEDRDYPLLNSIFFRRSTQLLSSSPPCVPAAMKLTDDQRTRHSLLPFRDSSKMRDAAVRFECRGVRPSPRRRTPRRTHARAAQHLLSFFRPAYRLSTSGALRDHPRPLPAPTSLPVSLVAQHTSCRLRSSSFPPPLLLIAFVHLTGGARAHPARNGYRGFASRCAAGRYVRTHVAPHLEFI